MEILGDGLKNDKKEQVKWTKVATSHDNSQGKTKFNGVEEVVNEEKMKIVEGNDL